MSPLPRYRERRRKRERERERDTLYRGLDASQLSSSRLRTRARLTRRIFALAYRLIHIPRLTSLPRRPSDRILRTATARVMQRAHESVFRLLRYSLWHVRRAELLRGACITAKRCTAIAKRILIIRDVVIRLMLIFPLRLLGILINTQLEHIIL